MVHQTGGSANPWGGDLRWVRDEDLSPEQRAVFAEFTSFRLTPSGGTVWPADEILP